jgi:hypothetical protein
MLFRERVGVYCEKHTDTLCGQNVEFWCVTAGGSRRNQYALDKWIQCAPFSRTSTTDAFRGSDHKDKALEVCSLCSVKRVKFLKHSGKYMYHLLYHYKTLNFSSLCICVFRMIERLKGDYFPKQRLLGPVVEMLCVFCEVESRAVWLKRWRILEVSSSRVGRHTLLSEGFHNLPQSHQEKAGKVP